MILHQIPTDSSPLLTRSLVVDTDSLSLARITLSRSLRLKVEALKPSDPDTPHVSSALESFSPTTLAARILKNLRAHVNPAIRLREVTVVEQAGEEVPEYVDFYELDGDGVSIMHTADPVFIAEHDHKNWLVPGNFRCRIDLSAEGWAYFFMEAYEELVTLNALQPTD